MATKQKTTTKRKATAKSWRVGEAAWIRLDGGRRVRVVREPDIDELIIDGKPLTDARADAIATDLVAEHRRRTGRPSLTGDAKHSPQVAFRLTPTLRAKAEKIAAATGQTVSQMARTALAKYLEGQKRQDDAQA